MSHTALARKYRPRRFSDVAAQSHVSETLRRAVAGGRVGHAYLFCGPRGIGKTTLARILAMALNCPDRDEDGEPCGVCASCRRIWSGTTALDVIEIDAASNRGVDDARDLRERAMYAPSEEGRYKVYIIDEAHMLTREAWNALLKILEEPPARVIFVFATTEPQKIEQTAAPILSRCQRFDLRRVGLDEIVVRLRHVVDAEGSEATDGALRMIARKAAGGMRDGLSILDQVLALTEGAVTEETVRQVLGLVEEERFIELLDLVADRRHGEIFPFVERLADEGYDLVEFFHGLVDALREALRLRLTEGDARESEFDAALAERAVRFEAADLIRMLHMASELEESGGLRRSTQPRLLLEMLLLRFSYLDRTVDLEELLDALGGAPGGREPAPPVGGQGRAAPKPASKGSGEPGRASSGAEAPGPKETPGAEEEAKREREPTAKKSSPPEPAPPALAGLQAAWDRMLGERGELPSGLVAALRSARPVEGEEGVVVLRVPALFDPLENEKSLSAVREALARQGWPATRVVVAADERSAAPERITRESLRESRLREWLEREPLLGKAVEELDLELLDS